jgi:hypothetical protein
MSEFEQEEKFIREHIVKEISQLLEEGHVRIAFVMMAQSIEVLGSFLDNKPFRAKAQSKIRFRNAIFQLFPPRYTRFNKSDRLYNQFRSSLTHMFIPSSHLKMVNDGKSHLTEKNGALIIDARTLLKDIEIAGEKILKRLKSEEIRRKKISFEWLD